ncbi:MAG: hypothetical protein ACKO5K_16345 [Armatimonadota bacterium]
MRTESTGRRRGRRPEDAEVRRARVVAALAELERGGVPFSVGDVAERAGVSRATLYRDESLRALIGDRGDGPAHRPVDHRQLTKLERDREEALEGRRLARRELRAARREIDELKDRVERLARENESRQQSRLIDATIQADVDRIRNDAYAEGFQAGTRAAAQRGNGRPGASAGLAVAAARLPKPVVASARRTLARALHPDLYADNPAAALLATEILKQLNELASRP